MFHTTNSTLSLSPLKMLHRCIVDHHITSHMPPFSIWTIPIPVQVLWHFITCKNILTLSLALHKSMDSTHLVLHLFSISQYGHACVTIYFLHVLHTPFSFLLLNSYLIVSRTCVLLLLFISVSTCV